jgi:uncharacterized tellurite resistance protein B-like protein
MTNIENLYYALGEIVYAMAMTDGQIQKEEKDKLHTILVEEFSKKNPNINVTEIVFRIFQRDRTDAKTAYDWAMKELKLNSHYLSEEMKQHFYNVLQNVANAFPPVDKVEHELRLNFMNEMKSVIGDPVFSNVK